MAPEPKKMKIDPTSSSRRWKLWGFPPPSLWALMWVVLCSISFIFYIVQNLRTTSSHAVLKDGVTTSSSTSSTTDIHLKIQQAKNYAVAQARQEGCMSNFRVFDSPFGNFLVPIIPTRSDLGG